MDTKHTAIIGAGIGGLAAALASQRRGFKVAVYERAPEIREIGAGLYITANARRALRDLGVDEALEAASSCVPSMYMCDYASGAIMREVKNEDMIQQYGLATLQVHRADLHGILKDAEPRKKGRTHERTAPSGETSEKLLPRGPFHIWPYGHAGLPRTVDRKTVAAGFASRPITRPNGGKLPSWDRNSSTI